jgi:hypothetical protein
MDYGVWLNLVWQAVLLGLVLGSCAAGVWAWFFWFTRPYRQARNLFAIGIGYVVIGLSSIGSLVLLLAVSEQMGIGRQRQGYGALYAWTLSFVIVGVLVIRSEIRWQTSGEGKKGYVSS